MALKFFKKELVSNPFFFNDKPVQFEVNSSNQGVLIFDDTKDDPKLAEALHLAIEQHRGGIALINAEEYEVIKKNENGKVFAASSQPERLRPLPSLGQKRSPVAAANSNPVRTPEGVPARHPQVSETTPFRPSKASSLKAKTE